MRVAHTAKPSIPNTPNLKWGPSMNRAIAPCTHNMCPNKTMHWCCSLWKDGIWQFALFIEVCFKVLGLKNTA